MAKRDGFVHLHCHTEFSMLDGAAKVTPLLKAAEKYQMDALAITDHGFLFGAYEFYDAARKTSVKPIIGLEGYLTPKTHRSERKRVQFGDGSGDDVSAKGAYTHMTLWAENTMGMHNLFRLASRASLEGFFYKPRADRELLHELHHGMIGTTGCPSGEVQTYLRLGQYKEARESAAEFRDIFGEGNFFVELMDHGLSIERNVRQGLLDISRDLNLPLVATNDLHYVHKEDAEAQDMLLCVSSGSTLDTPNRFKFNGDGYYLKSPEEMRSLFRDVPEACDNTLDIAERCEVEFREGMGTYMARFDVPDGFTEETWFRAEVQRGLERRYDEITDEIVDRANYEMGIIVDKGYAGYFLVVADFINWAKENGIRVGPGRGSGAGSLCAYALRITDLDPLRYQLLFERFLNPERPSMPDFDIDFDERRRGEVIEYVTNKYGDDRVCQIVTYGSIKAKQAVKDSARVMGRPFVLGEQISKAVPAPVQGKDLSLNKIFDESDDRYAEGTEFRALYESDPEVRAVVDRARGIEGLKRQWGVHAAGVIMRSEPLQDIIPVMKREQDGAIITQFDYHGAEALGLVKMDFLGLRNLTILDDALANVASNQGIELDLEEIAKDPSDKASYDLLATGETLGIFQLDGGGMRSMLKLMQPDHFEDISAALALYRPGPMGANSHTNYALRKTGRQKIEPIHRELAEPLAEILDTTYGLIVYQEQVQQIAQKVAGYSLGRADLLRRAMGKKKPEVLAAEFVPFSTGMKANGYSDAAISALWEILIPFSAYAFNKSHTAAYALVAYWTAFLKANYRVEFMAALLQSVRDDKDKSAIYLAECRRMGIDVLPPDVNESEAKFTPVGDSIRYGLAAIRNVGENVVRGIVEARREHGNAKDFDDFLNQVPLVVCNKRVIESLVKGGAFASLGHTRRALVEVLDVKVDEVLSLKRNEANGQDDLFGDPESGSSIALTPVPDLAEWDKHTKLSFEREMLGLYVSDHPLLGIEHIVRANRDLSIGELVGEEGPSSPNVTICGLITAISRKQSKNGDIWAIVTLEDLENSVEVMMYSRTYQSLAMELVPDRLCKVTGKVRERDDSRDVVAQSVSFPDINQGDEHTPVVISVPAVRCTPALVGELKQVLESHPGITEVRLRLVSDTRQTTLWRLDDRLRVKADGSLFADVKALLGAASVTV